jgi:large subunit ribosomal protein L21
MFAVIQTGGKQYKVAQDDVITVERLVGDAGSKIELGAVLAVSDGATLRVGSPLVPGAMVTAEVVEQTRGPKLIVFKKRRRQNSRRKNGHRQDLTVIKITGVKLS